MSNDFSILQKNESASESAILLDSSNRTTMNRMVDALLFSISLIMLFFSSRYNYLLFHSLAEIYSICIAYSIFIISWNSRRYLKNDYLLFIGVGYLFIGTIDLFHTLSYKGMEIFIDYEFYANQLWIAARFMEAITLLAAFMFLHKTRRLNISMLFVLFFITTIFIVLSIFTWKIFPICYIAGKGLTNFKIFSEYVISIILMLAALCLAHYRDYFDTDVYRLLMLSVIFTIASEVSFTFYISNYGFSNMVGHYFKIISFFFLYKSIVVKGITAPFAIIFRELKIKEEELQRQNELLANQARLDSMTGLLNSRSISEILSEEVERTVRYANALSIIMLDIDHFKNVNDTYGHQFGDDIIKQIAEIIIKNTRKIDYAGRIGGEEFLVILPQTKRSDCFVVAEKIRIAVAASTNTFNAHITISGGTASYENGDIHSFLKTADDNLYKAKKNGRNRIEQ